MGTKRKTPDVLDGMIEHVRYEMTRAIDFVVVGNAWCVALGQPIQTFAQQSILEAGLVHFRCLIEFLGDEPRGDRVMARDYLKDWDWQIGDDLREVAQIHGRLAHLGVIRRSIDRADEGGYSWEGWLNDQAPVVLRGVRDFLVRLRDVAPPRYELFVQPRSDLERVDLIAVLDRVVGHH